MQLVKTLHGMLGKFCFLMVVGVCVCVHKHVVGVLTAGTGLLWSPWWCRSTCQLTPGTHLHDHYTYRLEEATKTQMERKTGEGEGGCNKGRKEGTETILIKQRWRCRESDGLFFLMCFHSEQPQKQFKNNVLLLLIIIIKIINHIEIFKESLMYEA